jgi:hypothetical protein
MQEFQEHGISTGEQVILNNWRLYFQFSFLLELCTADGSQTRQCYLNYPDEKPETGWKTTIMWPAESRETRSRKFPDVDKKYMGVFPFTKQWQDPTARKMDHARSTSITYIYGILSS